MGSEISMPQAKPLVEMVSEVRMQEAKPLVVGDDGFNYFERGVVPWIEGLCISDSDDSIGYPEHMDRRSVEEPKPLSSTEYAVLLERGSW